MNKFYSTLILAACSVTLFAQQPVTVTPAEYQQMKDEHRLDPAVNYVLSDGSVSRNVSSDARVPAPVSTQSTTCNCMVPLDTTFQVVPFTFATAPDYRNDDFSAGPIGIPFQFDFFGTTYDSIFINNNGNISFGSSYGTFTATAFPSAQYAMIAPFWADVDTRDSTSGLVYYKVMPGYVIIRWDSVGYYSMHGDKRNTFQLIITDGVDTILPAGQNVSFCYGDMQWTTGDASGGIYGFGGTASTTGVNQGNGTDYFQVTRSIDSTYNFDGPYANDDGVSWLDDLEVGFNTALTGNVPPIVMNNTICDTIDVYTGDTIRIAAIDSIEFDFYITTPESDQQIVLSSITTNAPASALTYTQTINTATVHAYHCVFDARNLAPGSYYITATGTDDGSPAMQGSSSIYIETHYDSTLSIADHQANQGVNVFPNPAGDFVNVEHGADVSSLILTDINGATISTTATSGNLTKVETDQLAPGVYFIRLVNNDGSTSVVRFLKY